MVEQARLLEPERFVDVRSCHQALDSEVDRFVDAAVDEEAAGAHEPVGREQQVAEVVDAGQLRGHHGLCTAHPAALRLVVERQPFERVVALLADRDEEAAVAVRVQ